MSNTTNTNGVGFAGLLTILLIGLKLGHVIGWSWWWVLSPLWISTAIALTALSLVATAGVVIFAVKELRR